MAGVIKLRPLQGVGDISFEMSATEVKEKLGEPSTGGFTIRDDFSDLEMSGKVYSRQWDYVNLGLALEFHAPDDNPFDLRLRSISTENRNAEWLDYYPIGLDEQELLAIASNPGIPEFSLVSDLRSLEPGNPEFDIREYLCDELRTSFWITRRFVRSITMLGEWRPTKDITERPKPQLSW